jgi:hypothetical protein
LNTNIPIGLKHVLEVYRLVKESSISRLDAIKLIAQKHRIDQQTVRSACTRSLGISAKKLDKLLLEENIDNFEGLLVRRFPSYQNQIELFFREIKGESGKVGEDDPNRFIKPLFPKEITNLSAFLMLKDIRNKCLEWANRSDMPDDIKKQFNQWKNIIEGIEKRFKL